MTFQLKGQIERVTFSSDESSFTVCKVKVKGERNLVTVVGNIVNPTPGELLEMQGNWKTHPKFGDQFQIECYKTLVPATLFGIEKYLGSGLIKGIGPVMAKRIVKKFKLKSLEIIENNIEILAQIKGIGKKRVQMIRQAWEEQKEIRYVMLFLQSHGVSTGYAAKIFKHYGQDSIDVVKENPYRLAKDIFGIGFLTADKIAEKLGMEKEAPQRIEAGLEYVLHKLSEDGHVCYPYDELVEKIQEMLEVEKAFVLRGIARSFLAKQIVIEDINDDMDQFIENNKLVFLKKYYVCETGIAGKLSVLRQAPRSFRQLDTPKALEWIRGQINITLAKKQELAVGKALNEKVLIITGGPGTGKTTIINSILKIFKKAGMKIILAAPTGRAAKRMSEATWHTASTIHRMLEYSMKAAGFKRNSQNPLKCDALIVDEASMIDTVLMYHLLKAVPKGACLILVGDVNQLPSVGPGNVLNDIIQSNTVSVVELDTIFRQAKKSLIVVNAHKINNGEFPIIPKKLQNSNFY
ncbi:MAG: AAA family ATPase, partial [Desulfobacteraceae bacterium]|nr:AAA family ATPase [Desulfobacteraceae bacterium]